ncbi:MAG: phenylalanine--tRNA ligase subunit alpha [Oscillospiraceae bacterium]
MKEQLNNINKLALREIETCDNLSDLNNLRVKYLGKKGEITSILKKMGGLSKEDRPIIGALANKVNEEIEKSIKETIEKLKEIEINQKLKQETIDVTIDGKNFDIGKKHPLNLVLCEIKEIFQNLGFSVADGPEIELDYYNFEALNIPKNHPARDTQDTFYIDENTVLRTQTSPVQIRTMENQKPPIKIISPGRVFRSDATDATHSPVFHQIEGLVIDKGISMSDLKGTLMLFCQKLYGKDVKLRFRPHHFPFTEPSAEVDIMCFNCKGTGCKLCKNEGYIEILGCGMVHPNVLRNCNIDPEEYSGFAFGMGLERIVMRRFNIDDLRLFTENDIRFLNQF